MNYITSSFKVHRDKNISHGAKVLMTEIMNLNNLKYGCIASNKQLAEYINCSESSIKNYLRELKKRNYIKTVTLINKKGFKYDPTKKELPTNNRVRIIVPTNSIIRDLPETVKGLKSHYDKNDIESDWLQDYIDNFDTKNNNIKKGASDEDKEKARKIMEEIKNEYSTK